MIQLMCRPNDPSPKTKKSKIFDDKSLRKLELVC